MASSEHVNKFKVKLFFVDIELFGPAAVVASASLGLAGATSGAYLLRKFVECEQFCEVVTSVVKALGAAAVRKLTNGSLVLSLVFNDSRDVDAFEGACEDGELLRRLNEAISQNFGDEIEKFDSVKFVCSQAEQLDFAGVTRLNQEVELFNREFLSGARKRQRRARLGNFFNRAVLLVLVAAVIAVTAYLINRYSPTQQDLNGPDVQPKPNPNPGIRHSSMLPVSMDDDEE